MNLRQLRLQQQLNAWVGPLLPKPRDNWTMFRRRRRWSRGYTRSTTMAQNSNRHWTPEDDNRLRELLASRAPFSDIAIELGRDLAAVKARAQKLRRELESHPSAPSAPQDMRDTPAIDRPTKRTWTEQEVRALKDLSRTDTIEGIAKQLNRSVNSVKLKAFWLKLPLGR
jgi:capsid protein